MLIHKKMKNLTFYYIIIILPIGILYAISVKLGPTAFTIGLLSYALIYRPIVDAFRLVSIKAINQNEIWKSFIPCYRFKFFKQLYLG